jgi:hypothetical protein
MRSELDDHNDLDDAAHDDLVHDLDLELDDDIDYDHYLAHYHDGADWWDVH